MTKKLIILHVDGTKTEEPVEGKITLERLQKAVGGYIETVPLMKHYDGQRCEAYCDEEGKLKGYDINQQATQAWYESIGCSVGDVLVGDIAILIGTRLD